MTKLDPKTVAKALTPAVNLVLVAMAHAQLLREEVDGYASEILAAGNYVSEYTGERITEPGKAWTMGDEAFPAYHALVDAKVRAAGHDVPPDYCPALIAEEDQREAESALIKASEPFFGVTAEQLLCCHKGLEKHREFLDLLIGLCVNFPGYKSPLQNSAARS